MVRTDSLTSKIHGGFVAIPVARLMMAWHACGSNPLKRADFRTWLAAHEMLARRCVSDRHRKPDYAVAELARLLGGLSQRRVNASLRRLANAGIITFAPDRIEFPTMAPIDQPLDVIGGGRGSVLIPRRILRYLAAHGTSPALIATTLAILLRCLSRRRTGFNGRGRIKASWVAQVFTVDLRRVKAARAELLHLRWIEPEFSDQRAENRWGRAFRIDLQWDPTPSATLPPPPSLDRRDFATPSVDPDPLREENQHQEPAPPPGPGFRIEASREGEPRTSADPISILPEPTVLKSSPVTTDLPSPRLDDIRAEDLDSVERLLELYGQAISRGLVGGSESDRLKFLALAEHARSVGKTNPSGLFAALLRRRAWTYITQSEEDRARRKLKAHLWGAPPVISGPVSKTTAMPRLSSDARTVREVTQALAAAGYRGDGFPHLRRHDASWTRVRWDAALNELSGSFSL